jgi:hypothetical protein
MGAALALEVTGQASRPRQAVERAAAAIDGGAAARVLEILATPVFSAGGNDAGAQSTGRRQASSGTEPA